ncbi:MAG: aminomethyl-transferring glycine dehydrogenase subunit GcvPA [Acidobacteria bacterium]|nr:aminomethyl-transferring glycine dehydrogenase subunit GcvPA [Acidobacteriota bacterium]MBI3658379.1 aminomethyl-transferring glycine dehydrogenase subunit GcvPA [Acidobacteriota bacterium]
MRYISSSNVEAQAMLQSMGLTAIEQLFGGIPEAIRLNRDLDLPLGLSESETVKLFRKFSADTAHTNDSTYFLGAGAYNHFIPVVIDPIIQRSEFLTAYTPYQPEISQGTLQVIFEFQTLICQLTGMEVANASLYDGSTAMAEAVLMANRVNDRKKILVSSTVHPHYREVLHTYTKNLDLKVITLDFDRQTGLMDLDRLGESLGSDCAAVVIQNPNFFGCIEDVVDVAALAHRHGALLIVMVTEALALALLKPPSELGADIVAGEAQSFGVPIGFGGPYLGFFATRDKYKRSMPGRLAGRALDANGNPGFVLTLATREQFIRREKATSNICTNEGLCALMATIFLCTLGKQGLRAMAEQNVQKAHYAAAAIARAGSYRQAFSAPFFNEFVVTGPTDATRLAESLLKKKIVGGLPLGRYYPAWPNSSLLCVTEQNIKAEIDRLVAELNAAL